jgi:hypothetical protein
MAARQLDLFAGADNHSDHTAAPRVDRPRLDARELDDDTLIAAIPLFRSGIAAALRPRPGGDD